MSGDEAIRRAMVERYREKWSKLWGIPKSEIFPKERPKAKSTADLIIQRLKEKKKTKQWLAQRIVINNTTMGNVLIGRYGMEEDKINAISEVLDLRIEVSKLRPAKKDGFYYLTGNKEGK